jgi:hypothetical protein
MILLISASQVARITGMSHQCMAHILSFFVVLELELRALHLVDRHSIT